MSSESYHEPLELLSEHTKDLHRAVVTLIEELEAVDWYQQRAEACTDEALRAILVHNRNEEIEHAMMTLEWIRRTHPVFADNIATYLGTSGPITGIETSTEIRSNAPAVEPAMRNSSSVSSIGSLRGTK